jgi:hypothetical protein
LLWGYLPRGTQIKQSGEHGRGYKEYQVKGYVMLHVCGYEDEGGKERRSKGSNHSDTYQDRWTSGFHKFDWTILREGLGATRN